jgi:nickel-dependent lactate racemase
LEYAKPGKALNNKFGQTFRQRCIQSVGGKYGGAISRRTPVFRHLKNPNFSHEKLAFFGKLKSGFKATPVVVLQKFL